MRALVTLACGLSLLAAAPVARAQDPWLGRDKALHFSASAGLTLAGYAAGALAFEDDPPATVVVALTVGLVPGLEKEIWDQLRDGDGSARDLAWDLVGVGAGLLVGWLLHRLLDDE